MRRGRERGVKALQRERPDLAGHFLATQAIFTKKGNLAQSQIPFKYFDGAEG
jgi:hypothetical protein